MNAKDKKIADTLARYGEEFSTSIWRVQGTAVIYHKTLERIAAVAGIRFDDPKILRAEKDEAVILVAGEMDVGEVIAGTQTPRPRREWSIGEACIGTNYRVTGKQAAYPFAMAEKRAKDRVILKLIELSGDVYSEEEADEFKDARPRAGRQAEAETSRQFVQSGGGKGVREYLDEDRQDERLANDLIEPEEVTEWKRKITEAKTINAVTDLMLHGDTQKALSDMAEGFRESIRDHAKARMIELGWQPRKAG